MDKQYSSKLLLQKYLQDNGDMAVVDKIEGFNLEGRYRITKSLSEGAFGQIYCAQDLKKLQDGMPRPVIIKFTQNHEMNTREFNALNAIIEYTKKQYNGKNEFFANTQSSGQVLVLDKALYSPSKRMAIKKQKKSDPIAMFKSQTWSYLIQDELGNTMENHLFEKNEPFSEKTVLQIGI